ncbi:aminopeptidase [Deinococcus cellulosilyticus]|uniref:Aminopeptidase n=1 Tax=Deinococcus cellulosilyticus (strain DSM 18568 / NBRC 106333 / KACC 11606 / 5516J-15) TaxID=1223518 RepID=A0A511N7W7_DEIC1|nr:aminopeptidase [Deinococcus cellulosilyticus]GEM48933.1 aminopeptidase [Deinococcus cellulosilyticus NBRC 106333 = KACC 11606]
MFEQQFENFAEILVQVGLGLQKGQMVSISSHVGLEDFTRLVVRKAYQAGAKLVEVEYRDPELQRIRLENADPETLETVPEWYYKARLEVIEKGASLLNLSMNRPDLLKGQDQEKLTRMSQSIYPFIKPIQQRMMSDAVAWSLSVVPDQEWASKVFPELPKKEALEKLWKTILQIVRADREDPVQVWREHVKALHARKDWLNNQRFTALHFQNEHTDLTVGLAEGHLWAGGSAHADDGFDTEFVANIPTEEVFTLPDRTRIDGVVRSTFPLSVRGTVIDAFTLTFKDGRVTHAEAEHNQEVLQALLSMDEGALSLGEVALVPHSSPISQFGRPLFHGLFDENAASHVALGAGYRFCVEGGSDMNDEQFKAAGGNVSQVHEDFMIGSKDMQVTGITQDGKRIPVMQEGEWAFD